MEGWGKVGARRICRVGEEEASILRWAVGLFPRRCAWQEKDRLKKEMLLKLRETKANLLKMTDNQLDTTTKRTIAENEQMSSELAWQSRETEKLIRKNDKLIGENQSLKRELTLHKQTQEEFAKKVHVYQKTIKTLLSKLNTLDASQQEELQKLQFDEDEKVWPTDCSPLPYPTLTPHSRLSSNFDPFHSL